MFCSGFFINSGDLEVLEGSDKVSFGSISANKATTSKKSVGSTQKGLASELKSPYQLYVKANRSKVRVQNPELCKEKGGLNKLLGSMWKALDKKEKAEYAAAAVEATKEKLKSKSKADCAANKSESVVNPFHLFSKVKRILAKESDPATAMEQGGMNKLLGAMWKEVTDAEKEIWLDMTVAAKSVKAQIKSSVKSPFDCFCLSKIEERRENAEKRDLEKALEEQWKGLLEEERAHWALEAERENDAILKGFLSSDGSLAGMDLFRASISSSEPVSDEIAERLWQENISAQALWDAAGVVIGEECRSKKIKKKKREEGNDRKKKKKKVKCISNPIGSKVGDENASGNHNSEIGSTESKKERSKNATVIAFAIGNKAPKTEAVSESSDAAKSQSKKLFSHYTGPLWSKPPIALVDTLSKLKLIVTEEVRVQHELELAKSKKGKIKTVTPLDNFSLDLENASSLKKLTVNVEEHLHALDSLAIEYKMPGTDPLMKAPKQNPKLLAVASESSSSDTAGFTDEGLDGEPTYLGLLSEIVNAPKGSSISLNQIRACLLKYRCRGLIRELKEKMDTAIPVLATAIREKIEENDKYTPNVPEKAEEILCEDKKSEQKNDDEVTGDKEGTNTKKTTAPPLPYICKWDRELRRHLFHVLGKLLIFRESCPYINLRSTPSSRFDGTVG